MVCPRCGARLEPEGEAAWSCAACNRGFVSEAVLVARAAAMSGLGARLRSGPPTTGDACPRCATPMEPGHLAGVAIERCRVDGLWFDRDLLAAALLRDAEVRTAREANEDASRTRDGAVGLLGELFWFLD